MGHTLNVVRLTVWITCAGLLVGCSPYNKVRLQSGSFTCLKQEKLVNVEYQYDGLRVGRSGKKSVAEAEYMDKKVDQYNKKEAGRGDRWREAWVYDRAARFQPKFEMLLNKQFSPPKLDLKFGAYKEAKYTLVLQTQYIEPGYNVAISRLPALLTAEAQLLETQNRANKVAVVTLVNCTGSDVMGFDFDTGLRIQESYAKAGKELGILVRDKLK